MKLSHQLKGGASGGQQISDLAGAGSDNPEDNAKCLIPRDVTARARVNVAGMLLSKRPRTLYVTLPNLPKPDFTIVTASQNRVSRESKNLALDITEEKTGETSHILDTSRELIIL